MSKRRKGVSLEEKRERLMQIYHDSKEVFNLKEVEKLGSKAGIVLQTIKDVNQALVDDNLVDFDKIGSGNYFWSFPSKYSEQRKRKRDELHQKYRLLQERVTSTQETIAKERELRVESEERTEKLSHLIKLGERLSNLKENLKQFEENDPRALNELQKSVKTVKEGADRWTDNAFNLRSWIVQKRGVPTSEVDKWLGIKDDFDYVD
uniref:Meiotic nuclear division protein putative n=1 Tax=Albugo laibachii Nc14 TaxID=890382 RepID=F0WB11_9STRA|nr:meiotic nuclear division protein putative [Albugo laibachii Nc14]CCA18394.1 meiotic nuclear division protein putative [Albugo laibachii Nc14]|eukprot:CCA18394.1 meiotic nuclear division protein putative [Albugo laibachii Nc14]